jgi:hypothetical protein
MLPLIRNTPLFFIYTKLSNNQTLLDFREIAVIYMRPYSVTTVRNGGDIYIQFSSQYASVCVSKASCLGKHISVSRDTFHHCDASDGASISFLYDHSSPPVKPLTL